GPPDDSGVPHALQAIALEALRDQKSDALGIVTRSRAQTRDGAWLTLHAAVLDVERERVAVVIEPAKPLELASLIVRAHGLTKREAELVRLVLHGLDTAQIAGALAISPYTVQDHLKSIFDKLGVNSRKQLVERIFVTHYLPRLRTPVGPDGWFSE